MGEPEPVGRNTHQGLGLIFLAFAVIVGAGVVGYAASRSEPAAAPEGVPADTTPERIPPADTGDSARDSVAAAPGPRSRSGRLASHIPAPPPFRLPPSAFRLPPAVPCLIRRTGSGTVTAHAARAPGRSSRRTETDPR